MVFRCLHWKMTYLKNIIRDEDCLKSRPTNTKIINAICEQILARNNFEMVYHVLDVLVFTKSTASAIRECIDNIADKIRWQRRSVFAC